MTTVWSAGKVAGRGWAPGWGTALRAQGAVNWWIVSGILRRIFFWEYPRASWQYDVIVVAILAFIFLTPREVFRDQPRASSIVLLPNETAGVEVFYLEPKLLSGFEEKERFRQASLLLERRDGKRLQLYRLTPIFDSEKEITGFMAYTRPLR